MIIPLLLLVRYKVYASVFLVFLSVSLAFAQDQKTTKETANIDSLITEVPGLMRSDKNLALQKMQQIQALSTKFNYKHGLIESAFFRSWLTYRYASADQCIKSIDSAIKNIPNLSSDAAEVKFYILKGQCYVKKTQFDRAINNFSLAIKIAEKKKDYASKTGALISVGWAYMEASKPKEAIGFFSEVLSLNPEKTYGNRALVLCNIAACYNILENYKSAEQYALQGVEAARQSGSMVDLANGLNILARSNYQRGKFDKAIIYLKEASKAREKVEDPAMLASDYLELADVYRKTKQPNQAILYAKKAETISYLNKIDLKLANAYEVLATNFTDLGDYKNATHYYQKLLANKDSTGTGNYSKALAELQVKFATEKKITENLKLKKENLESKLSISNKQKWLVVLIAGLFILIASAIYVFYLTRGKYRTRLALEQLNEQKNRTIAVMQTEESERRRIAGDLHDGVCQMLAAASLQLKNAKGNEEKLAKVDDLLDRATAEVRTVSHQMTPELLLHYGLLAAIKEGVAGLNDVQAKTVFTLFEDVDFEDIDQMLAVVLYRAFQELTNNVLKHANATMASIHLIINSEEALLMIEDNGAGFDPNINKFGLGLKNLESRIKLYEGNLNIDSMLGKGTTSILQFKSPIRQIGIA